MLRSSICYLKSNSCEGSSSTQRYLQAGFNAGTGIEVIPESVANEIKAQHRQHHRKCREQNKMWGVEEMGTAIVEHGTPACGRRRYAEAEKAHGGFGKDCACHSDGGLHNHWLNDIWQDVAHDNAQVAGAECAGCFDKFAFAGGEHLAADQARVANPSAEREREHQVEDAGTAKGNERDRQQNSRERHKRVHQHDVDEAVDASTVISSDRADNQTEPERYQHDATANKHGDARSVNDAGEDVASEFVSAEPVCM